MRTIKSKLILTYSLISMAVICSIAVVFILNMEKEFERHAKRLLAQRITNIVKELEDLYDEEKGSFDQGQVEVIGNAALQNGIFIHLQTKGGEMDWDIQTHKSEECQLVLEHAEKNMSSRYFNFQGGYQEAEYILSSQEQDVGKLTLGYYGPYSFSDEELRLMNNLVFCFLIIGVLFAVFAIILGEIMARKIADPISDTIRVAGKIANGEYGVQSQMLSRTAETRQLITAINEMSLELQKEEEQKRQITADVAHELRTPLTNIQGHLEAMIDGIWEPDVQRLESCREEILRLSEIVRQLQELYLLENQKGLLRYEEFDFFELCKKLYENFNAGLEEKCLELTLSMKQGSMVWGDKLRIMQCMVNLMGNAVRHAKPGTSIYVRYQKFGNMTEIQVENKGDAIPEECLPHLFERFYRVDKSRNVKTGGMGIGLSITKAIVERHGGEIRVESGTDRTVFFITLLGRTEDRMSYETKI